MIEEQYHRENYWNNFISAEEVHLRMQNGFRSGFPQLDELLGLYGLYPGSLTLIQGDLPRSILRSMIVKLTTNLLITNPRVEIAFVDGENLFPYYELSLEVRKRGFDPLTILDRIQLSRAFNYHQITEILTKQLPQLIAENSRIRIVLVPQISSQFLSKEALQYLQYDKLPATESLFELTQAVGKLKSLILQYDLLGIMTAASAPNSKHKPLGGTFLAHAATTIIRVAIGSKSTSKDYNLCFTVQKGGPVIQVALSERSTTLSKQQTSLTRFWR
jgi:RecA/RadA recombinase